MAKQLCEYAKKTMNYTLYELHHVISILLFLSFFLASHLIQFRNSTVEFERNKC